MKLLIVDDQQENRYLLETLFSAKGYEVVSTINGKEALEALRNQEVDLVISDILMPVMDGYQLCREIRGDENLCNMLFIFYTATYVDKKDEELALKLGADLFLRKPMSPQGLYEAVEEIQKSTGREKVERSAPVSEQNDKEILKLYSEQLVKKLEKKMVDLEREAAERIKAVRALKESEEKYRTLVEQASDAIYILDRSAQILDVNPAACSILQYSYNELRGMSFMSLIPVEDLEKVPFKIPEIKAEITLVFERKLRRKDGSIVPLEISAKALKDGRIQGIARDITERKKAEEALRESEERYALAARGANDGLWDWDLIRDEIYYSPRWKAMLGYEEEEIGTEPDDWFKLVHPDDVEELKTELQAHRSGVSPHFENEYRILHKDTTFRWVLARGIMVRDRKKTPTRMAGSLTDITDRKRAEEQLLHDAFHDSLTGLPNRALFLDRLHQSCGRLKRAGDHKFAVIHIDLDRFKVINEGLGHAAGDELLKNVAERIFAGLRPGDTLARALGDEFLILLDSMEDIRDVTRVVEEIKAKIATSLTIDNRDIFVTASMGIVTSSAEKIRPEDYLRDAHIAMHRAKARGRGSYESFDQVMHEKVMARLTLETALRAAVEHNEFLLTYQPIMDLATGQIVSFEVLVRWNHPERGLLLPEEFISIAEETGLIVDIDRIVLREACRQLRTWVDGADSFGDVSVSVNLSGKQFSEPDLVDFIETVLKKTEISPNRLSLELTESTIMADIDRTKAILHSLQSLGVRLHIDDFGTGYSSLSYLQHFPIDTLKIDRSFVSEMEADDEQSPIVQTIISLAHNMGMKVLAEGVEKESQCLRLKALKCNYAQGFYFARPMVVEKIDGEFLQKKW